MILVLILSVLGIVFPNPIIATRSSLPTFTAPSYTITDLGTLGGSSNYSLAYGINDAGQVVGGSYDTSNRYTGFRYTAGTMTPIYGPSSTNPTTELRDINQSGKMVGRGNYDRTFNSSTSYDAGNLGSCFYPNCYYFYGVTPSTYQASESRPAIFSGGTATALTAMSYNQSYTAYGYYYVTNDWGVHWTYLGTWTSSSVNVVNNGLVSGMAYGVNNAGHAVGYATVGNSTIGTRNHAFVFSNGSQLDLGSLFGNLGTSYAYEINNSGQSVGQTQIVGGQYRAFLYQNGAMQDLGTLGGTSSNARSINDSGQIVGTADSLNGIQHAFLYDSINGMQDLGTLGGYSSAEDINNSGEVVGTSRVGSQDHAFVYDPTNGMQDLNTLIPSNSGWVLQTATAINTSGQIVGYGTHNGFTHAFLLTPINSATTTTLTANVASTTYGDSVIFTANVTGQIGNPPDGEALEFFDGTTSLGSVLISIGGATLSLSSLNAGTHSITATYSGNGTLEPS